MLLYLAPKNGIDPEELVEWSSLVDSNDIDNLNFDIDGISNGLDIYVGF